MKRKAITLISAFCLFGSAPAFAAADDEVLFKRFVKVGSFADQVTYSLLGARPNVNMIVSERPKENGSNISLIPFTSVNRNQKVLPHIYYIIDNAPLTTALYSKIEVFDPKNVKVHSSNLDPFNTQKNGTAFVGIASLDEITFDKPGDYKIQFFMKAKADGNYVKVGQTIIKVK